MKQETKQDGRLFNRGEERREDEDECDENEEEERMRRLFQFAAEQAMDWNKVPQASNTERPWTILEDHQAPGGGGDPRKSFFLFADITFFFFFSFFPFGFDLVHTHLFMQDAPGKAVCPDLALVAGLSFADRPLLSMSFPF